MPILELACASGANLCVVRFAVEEAMSTLFSVSLWGLSADNAVDLSAIVGQPARFVAVADQANVRESGARVWSGIVEHAQQLHGFQHHSGKDGRTMYFLRLVPHLWLLTQRRGYRIYQQLPIPAIVDQLLSNHAIDHLWKIDPSEHPRHEYKVQYGETEYQFFSRLLEDAGLVYTLQNKDTGEATVVLSDRPESAPARPGSPIRFIENPAEFGDFEYATHVRFGREVRPGATSIRDHDLRRPSFSLFAAARLRGTVEEHSLERYEYDPGGFLIEVGQGDVTPVADDRGATRHSQAYGSRKAERQLDGERVGARYVAFDTNVTDIVPGVVFFMTGHPHPEMSATHPLLVSRVVLSGRLEGRWTVSITAVLAHTPYRPRRVAPRPTAHGVQSATVVGPESQEIHTDEFERIRVRFPWEREGSGDEQSSCWIRMQQQWAGAGYGYTAVPRVGQEVLVSFLEGDPERPVILGGVHNAAQCVPYGLPREKTRSTWKSDSTMALSGFNEIMFEDRAGGELVWQQAQNDRASVVKNDEIVTIARDQRSLVKNDRSDRAGGRRRRWIGRSADIVVKGRLRDRIENNTSTLVQGNAAELTRGKRSLVVLENLYEQVGGAYALRVGRELHAQAEDVICDGAQDVTLRGPGGFVRIDGSGVTIVGTIVKINVSGEPGGGEGTSPELPQEPPIDEAPSLLNLHWSAQRVPVGALVKAIFTVKHFKVNETVVVKIYECNTNGSRKQVDQVEVEATKTDGDIEVDWCRASVDAESDMEEDEAEGDIGPLDYRFEVETRRVRSEISSSSLWLTNTVIIEVEGEDGHAAKDGTEVVLTTADGEKRATTTHGEARFEHVVVGTMTIEW